MGSGLILAVRPKRQDCIECNPKADIHQPCEPGRLRLIHCLASKNPAAPTTKSRIPRISITNFMPSSTNAWHAS